MIESEHSGIVETKEESKKVFLEVGLQKDPGAGPLVFNPSFREQFPGQYIGIDIQEWVLDDIKHDLKHGEANLNAFFIKADAKNIPLGDKTADTIYFGNVFGSGVSGRSEFLTESRRVLKDDGRLIIFENITPDASITVDDRMTQAGFEVEEEVRIKDPNWEEKINQLGIRDKKKSPFSFILIARPKK